MQAVEDSSRIYQVERRSHYAARPGLSPRHGSTRRGHSTSTMKSRTRSTSSPVRYAFLSPKGRFCLVGARPIRCDPDSPIWSLMRAARRPHSLSCKARETTTSSASFDWSNVRYIRVKTGRFCSASDQLAIEVAAVRR